MADSYEEYQREVFERAEAQSHLSDELEAHADPVFRALAEGNLRPLIKYLRGRGDITYVPLSRALANHLSDMLCENGRSLFRLSIAGRLRGERGREHRLLVRHRQLFIGYCTERLIGDVRGAKNAKWAKGQVGAELKAGTTKVDDALRLVRAYLSANERNRRRLNDAYSTEYVSRFDGLVRGLGQSAS